tara:strand:+ start:164 stop:598 length:435 start_codon:yes stop_codon:yes gene_type:complete
MGSTRSHPLPAGIFVKMPSPPLARSQPISAWYTEAESISVSNEFSNWTEQDLNDEINRLQGRIKEIENERVQVRGIQVDCDEESDSDDIMNDPDVRKMVENGEHICHMFDGECMACTMDEEDDEVRVLTDEEVQKDPEMTAHFC